MIKGLLIIATIVIGLVLGQIYIGPNSNNLEDVKNNAKTTWNSIGFEIVGYEGYQWGFGYGDYGGANVWYNLSKIPDNGITYTGYLVKWGNEYHVYGPTAIDAIRPQK